MFKKLFKALGRNSELKKQDKNIAAMQTLPDSYVDVFKEYLNLNDDNDIGPLSLQAVFLNEAQELLQKLVEVVEDWKKNAKSDLLLQDAYRYLHTLKGAANLVDFTQIGSMVHNIEAYISESIKEQVLGDRAFFLGVERQLKAVDKAIQLQVQKYKQEITARKATAEVAQQHTYESAIQSKSREEAEILAEVGFDESPPTAKENISQPLVPTQRNYINRKKTVKII